jgi:hypothetical protein
MLLPVDFDCKASRVGVVTKIRGRRATVGQAISRDLIRTLRESSSDALIWVGELMENGWRQDHWKD